MTSLKEAMFELANSLAEFAKSQAQATFQIQASQLERLEVQMGQMAKIISEEERSFPTFEEPKIVEVDAKVLNEIVAKEKESTSIKPKEMKKEVEKTILEMILWGEVHKKVEKENLTPISKVDDTILELMENERASKVKKAPNSLGKHASLRVYVLKKLFEHNYGFLGKDGEHNHHPIRSW